MSWSIQRTGTREAVATAVAADLDKSAAQYEGHEEQKDILAAKERILAVIAGLDMTPDTWCPVYGVQVTASGSASKYSSNIHIGVTRIALTLDAAPAATT